MFAQTFFSFLMQMGLSVKFFENAIIIDGFATFSQLRHSFCQTFAVMRGWKEIPTEIKTDIDVVITNWGDFGLLLVFPKKKTVIPTQPATHETISTAQESAYQLPDEESLSLSQVAEIFEAEASKASALKDLMISPSAFGTVSLDPLDKEYTSPN